METAGGPAGDANPCRDRAGLFSGIFIDENIPETRILVKIGYPVPVKGDNPDHLFNPKVFRPPVVFRRLDQDFVCADTVHHIVNPNPFSSQFPLNLKEGMKARNSPHPPSRGILLSRRPSYRSYFRGGFVFMVGTESTVVLPVSLLAGEGIFSRRP